jgi:NAD(P)-dependent dehydrogenase (short-subunit alcohol dehydrogenase family)
MYFTYIVSSAGQVGPQAPFFSDPSAPECKDTATLGRALFDSQSVDEWANLHTINVAPLFFVSTAFLGLLEKGTKETSGYVAVIINITSISSVMKTSQNHVSLPMYLLFIAVDMLQFAYNANKSAASHLTKMLSTELALRDIPIRVNAIAPGAWPSEMTRHQGKTISADVANKIAMGVMKIPAERGGT